MQVIACGRFLANVAGFVIATFCAFSMVKAINKPNRNKRHCRSRRLRKTAAEIWDLLKARS